MFAETGKKRQSQFRLASADKYSTKVTLDTDEESMAEYMENLSPSSSADMSARTPRAKSPPSARKKVTSHLFKFHELIVNQKLK